jgi:hypothetical protein
VHGKESREHGWGDDLLLVISVTYGRGLEGFVSSICIHGLLVHVKRFEKVYWHGRLFY